MYNGIKNYGHVKYLTEKHMRVEIVSFRAE
jgi:hypothetical protein